MQRKQLLTFLVIGVVVASAAGTLYWFYGPSPLQSAYDRIVPGMSDADVERLVPDVGESDNKGGMLEYIEWTGWDHGRPVRVRTPREPNAHDHPALAKSLYVRMEELDTEDVDKSWFVLKDPKSGEVVGRVRVWSGDKDRLSVLFDKKGVVEKVYIKVRK